MSKIQPNPVHSFSRGASVARGLNANRHVAQHIVDATFYDEDATEMVTRCIAEQPFVKGQAVVLPGETFYLIASKFAYRYYVAVERDGTWYCSSKEQAVAARCIALAQAYRSRKAA